MRKCWIMARKIFMHPGMMCRIMAPRSRHKDYRRPPSVIGALSLTIIAFVHIPGASRRVTTSCSTGPLQRENRQTQASAEDPGLLPLIISRTARRQPVEPAPQQHPASSLPSLMRDRGGFQNLIVDFLGMANDSSKIIFYFFDVYPCYLIHLNTSYYFYR